MAREREPGRRLSAGDGVGSAARLAQAPRYGRERLRLLRALTTPRQLPGAGAGGGGRRRPRRPPGSVPDAAAGLLDRVGADRLVAHGGGRVIDTAKALASVSGARVAAIPTTLSGAEITGIHRLPTGAEQRVSGLVRPELADRRPGGDDGLPEQALRASAMNSLAHGADSLYTPFANPVSRMLGAARGGADRRRARRRARAARPRRPGSRLASLRLRDRLRPLRPAPRHLPDAGAGLRQSPRRDKRGDPALGDGVHGAAGAAELDKLAGRSRNRHRPDQAADPPARWRARRARRARRGPRQVG